MDADPQPVPASGQGETDLVRRAQAGDRAAFAHLFLRHRSVAWVLCRRVLERADVADDVMQDAALVAFVNLDRLRRPDRFGPWLCGISLNVARRWLRTESRLVGDPTAADRNLSGGVHPGRGPEEQALDGELAATVAGALAELPAGQRAAVRLFYFEGLSVQEVAAALATTRGAVKSRLHKARTALRPKLSSYEEVPVPQPSLRQPVPVRVVDVRRETRTSAALRRHVMILEATDGTRRLPIYVGPAEGTALALELTGSEVPRPMTYGFVMRVVDALGGSLTRVRINRLVDETFYAEVTLDGPTGSSTVDARPSDAVNLALLLDAPISVDAVVFEECQRGGHHTVAEDDYPDGPDRIAAEAIELIGWCPSGSD